MIGMLSVRRIGRKQLKHRDDGQTMLFSNGKRAMRTFRNDPTIRPRMKIHRHQRMTGMFAHHAMP